MWEMTTQQMIVLSLMLVACAYDIKSARIPNMLVVLSLFVLQVLAFYSSGLSSLIQTGISFCVLLMILVPLFATKVIGGGDVKLMLAFSPMFTLSSALETLIYTLIWGAVFSIVVLILQKKSKQTIESFYLVLHKLTLDSSRLTKIPFTIAILLGLISQWNYPIQIGVNP